MDLSDIHQGSIFKSLSEIWEFYETALLIIITRSIHFTMKNAQGEEGPSMLVWSFETLTPGPRHAASQ